MGRHVVACSDADRARYSAGSMDTLTTAQRSARMALIRSKDTKPELTVRRLVHRLGYRYRLHRKELPGTPDLAFIARRKVIFVHGCFWHAHETCKVANKPKTRRSYWSSKFRTNVARDRRNERLLKRSGWEVLTIWECETGALTALASRLVTFLGSAGSNARRSGRNHAR
jgi:DNA mismatch endonuclease (patch repair protein)